MLRSVPEMSHQGRRNFRTNLNPLSSGGREVNSVPSQLSAIRLTAITWSIRSNCLLLWVSHTAFQAPQQPDAHNTHIVRSMFGSSCSGERGCTLGPVSACWRAQSPTFTTDAESSPRRQGMDWVAGHSLPTTMPASLPSHNPTRGTLSVVPLAPLAGYLDAWSSPLQFLLMAPQNHSAKLCDSVLQATAQVQGHSLYLGGRRECCCSAGGGCNPSEEGSS